MLTCACTFFSTNIVLIFKKTNTMKKNLYHVKFLMEYNGKKHITSVNNVEAKSAEEAFNIAFDKVKEGTTYETIIILKRKPKEKKCKDI